MAGAGLVAALSHATGPILLVALLLIPMLRRDRAAWELRVGLVLALAGFAAVWGGHVLRWSGGSGALPPASPEWLGIVINELLAPVPDNRVLLLPLLALGAVAIVVARGPRSRVWICLFVVPVAVLYGASLSRGVLVPKSLMPFAWGVPLALGALCGWVREKARPIAFVLAAALVVLAVAYVPESLRSDEGSGQAMDDVFAAAEPGEGFAFISGRWQFESLLDWYGTVEGRRLVRTPEPIEDLTIYTGSGDPVPERVWFLGIADDRVPPELSTCGPMEHRGVFTAQCVEVGRG